VFNGRAPTFSLVGFVVKQNNTTFAIMTLVIVSESMCVSEVRDVLKILFDRKVFLFFGNTSKFLGKHLRLVWVFFHLFQLVEVG